MNMSKKTLVLGASPNPARYSHLAINELRKKGHEVIAIGKRPGKVNDVEINTQQKPVDHLHTVTLYLNANNQKPYYNYILGLMPERIIFNPGAENQELANLAKKKNILPLEACTLVLLATGQY